MKYQNQRTNNRVYDCDVVNIIAQETVINRKPYIFTSFSGQQENPNNQYTFEDSQAAKVYANLENSKKWV